MKKIILVLIFSLTLCLTGCSLFEDPSVNEEEIKELIEELIPEANVSTTYDLASFQTAVTNMLSVAKKGVIGVVSNSPSGSGTGSGVIYKQEGDTYYAVTNHHVIEDSSSMNIIYEKYGVIFYIEDEFIEILGSDPTTDLGIFTFESDEGSTGRWLRQFSGRINAKWFGLTGVLGGNDTAAMLLVLQYFRITGPSAVLTVPSITVYQGGVVFFPKGF